MNLRHPLVCWMLLLGPASALAGPNEGAVTTLTVEVDARDLPRRLVHTKLVVPCPAGGELRLWYPKWVRGTHGPHGRLEDVGGLQVETPDGRLIPWRRDEVELFRVACTPPAGAREVVVRLDTICNMASLHAMGCYTYGNSSLGVINWNTCLLYPGGFADTAVQVRLRLLLPAKWNFATALKVETAQEGLVTFAPVSLYDLFDSPLIAGEHLRSIKLDTGASPPAYLDLVSESPGALQLDPKVVGMYGRVVREAAALFGACHYPEYHFLVVCSDDLGYFGLEHHACCIAGVGERDLLEDKHRRGWIANLLPHEYVHSWCGKFRRPAGMVTPNVHTPEKTRLLWVYEGLTSYLGDLLMVRGGLVSPEEYKESLAWTLGDQMRRVGRRWRSLEDTGIASPLLRAPSRNWNDLRREQDYYMEGMLLWMEIDLIIREATKGERSLDDFCKAFMGPLDTKERIVPYEQADVARALGQVAEYDWDAFLTRRVAAPLESLPLDVVARAGYRLGHAAKPSGYQEYVEGGPRGGGFVSARDSLGLDFGPDGRITHVVPGMPGDRAGLVPGMQVAGVNGKKFSRERLRDALADSPTLRRLDLLLLDGENYRTVRLPYADGPRYLELVRDERRPDLLSAILKSAAGR